MLCVVSEQQRDKRKVRHIVKIQNIKDMNRFFEVVNSCQGKVELVTSEGDRLNLKSQLSKYVALAEIFSGASSIPELEIVAYEPQDTKKLVEFMISQ